jgi:hypothetical protein
VSHRDWPFPAAIPKRPLARVLGAWGCAALGKDPRQTAALARRAIEPARAWRCVRGGRRRRWVARTKDAGAVPARVQRRVGPLTRGCSRPPRRRRERRRAGSWPTTASTHWSSSSAPHQAEPIGRLVVPPGVAFRMLFVGSIEDLRSHREISWRRTDNRSLGDFLGLDPADPMPTHLDVSKTHQRLPKGPFGGVFRLIVSAWVRKGLLWGDAIRIDPTAILANSSMRSFVRRDPGMGSRDSPNQLARKVRPDDPMDDDAIAADSPGIPGWPVVHLDSAADRVRHVDLDPPDHAGRRSRQRERL